MGKESTREGLLGVKARRFKNLVPEFRAVGAALDFAAGFRQNRAVYFGAIQVTSPRFLRFGGEAEDFLGTTREALLPAVVDGFQVAFAVNWPGDGAFFGMIGVEILTINGDGLLGIHEFHEVDEEDCVTTHAYSLPPFEIPAYGQYHLRLSVGEEARRFFFNVGPAV